MKEALLILLVIAILLALTAVRYRKQIAGIIGMARMLKEAKDNISQTPGRRVDGDTAKSVPLVNCATCGVWVTQTKAVRVGERNYCSDACLAAAAS